MRLDPALIERVIQRAVPAPVLGARVSSTSEVTGPSVHSTASVNSNNASARAVNDM